MFLTLCCVATNASVSSGTKFFLYFEHLKSIFIYAFQCFLKKTHFERTTNNKIKKRNPSKGNLYQMAAKIILIFSIV